VAGRYSVKKRTAQWSTAASSILLVLLLFFLASCGAPGVDINSGVPATATPAGSAPSLRPLTASPPGASATPANAPGAATQTTDSPATPATGTAVPPPATPLAFPNEGDGYRLLVNYAVTYPGTEQLAPPPGRQWLLLVARADNVSGEPITVAPGSLTLVDTVGRRHVPDTPDAQTQPPLIGAHLAAGEGLLGLVRFTVPQGTAAHYLEWCPQQEDCPRPLLALVP
jgi:hypothetical protein